MSAQEPGSDLEAFEVYVIRAENASAARAWLRDQSTVDIELFRASYNFNPCPDKRELIELELSSRERREMQRLADNSGLWTKVFIGVGLIVLLIVGRMVKVWLKQHHGL